MNFRATISAAAGTDVRIATACIAIAVCLALTARVFAQKEAEAELAAEAASNSQEPQPDPSQGDFPNSFLPGNDPLFGPNVKLKESTEVDGEGAKPSQMPNLQEWQRKQRQLFDLQMAVEQKANEYRRAMENYQRLQPTPPAQQAEREAMLRQIEELRAHLAMMARGQQAKATPLPENAEFRVFRLRYVKAHDVAAALNSILGDAGPRIAIDERTNMLIIAGDERQHSVVKDVVQSLDEPGAVSKEDQPSETLQLRIVWLLDGVTGKEPTSSLVSPQVLEALQQLGFEAPSVVCQQVTTLTLGEDNRRGRFQFAVPVLVNGQLWQLGGNGQITPAAGERFAVQFDLAVQQQNIPNPQGGRLGGSIYTPLGHYTVMGTTTFVETSNLDPDPDPAIGGAAQQQQQQHLSAFVVYLDRAPEFPAAAPAAADQRSRR